MRSNQDEMSPFSAGILAESVHRPVICNNSVSDCDRGILLTGSDAINPPNVLQLAATLDDALAFPPVMIPLNVPLQVTTDAGLPNEPYFALLAAYSPPFTAPVSGLGENADPILACDPLLNDLTGNVGVCRRGACNFVNKTTNIENVGGIATVVVQSAGAPFVMTGPSTGAGPSVMISKGDGDELIAALEVDPTIVVTIDTVPSAGVMQSFINLDKSNQLDISPVQVNSATDVIVSTEDLNTLGWELGDALLYDCNGAVPISDLVCSTTVFAVVGVPGFSEDGLIQTNKVDNCSISGYQDDRTPNTSSAWVDNTAFNNGTPASAAANYAINWAGVVPVTAGDLADYPTGSEKAYNVSLIP